MHHDDAATPLGGLDDLLAPFHAAETPRSHFRVGTEAEKFGILRASGAPLPYAAPDQGPSVQAVFQALIERHGWHPEAETSGGEPISLRRGGASITLEPGAQLELSGAPVTTIHQTCAEFYGHMAELRDISDELGIHWLGLGFHPFARQEDLDWVPKLRYGIMREYLPTRGRFALDMMRRTATVQANFDYESEEDALRKLRVALRLSPVATGMFANSPWVEEQATGERSHRARVWLEVDPDRAGLLPWAWNDAAGYRDYVEWALDVPMFMFKREGKTVANTGQTFRSFLADGYGGHQATRADWTMHLNTLFPEVRLKGTLEVRGCDGQSTRMTCALPALWKGLLYEPEALSRAEALSSGWTYADVEAARRPIADHGLGARFAGREVGEWADELLRIAEGGLERLGHLNRQGQDETIHLKVLRDLLDRGETPADQLLRLVGPSADLQGALLTHAKV